MSKVVYSVRLSREADHVITARANEARARPSTFLAALLEEVLLGHLPKDDSKLREAISYETLWRLDLLLAVRLQTLPEDQREKLEKKYRSEAQDLLRDLDFTVGQKP